MQPHHNFEVRSVVLVCTVCYLKSIEAYCVFELFHIWEQLRRQSSRLFVHEVFGNKDHPLCTFSDPLLVARMSYSGNSCNRQ